MIFKYFKSQDSNAKAHDLSEVNRAVESFMKSLEISRFKASSFHSGDSVVVLIQAEPHRQLRYSNLVEIKLKVFVENEVKVPVKAVFWRFKVDEKKNKGALEQAVYEWTPPAGSAQTPVTEVDSFATQSGEESKGPPSIMMHPSRTVDQFDLQEASWDEFEQLSGKDKP